MKILKSVFSENGPSIWCEYINNEQVSVVFICWIVSSMSIGALRKTTIKKNHWQFCYAIANLTFILPFLHLMKTLKMPLYPPLKMEQSNILIFLLLLHCKDKRWMFDGKHNWNDIIMLSVIGTSLKIVKNYFFHFWKCTIKGH